MAAVTCPNGSRAMLASRRTSNQRLMKKALKMKNLLRARRTPSRALVEQAVWWTLSSTVSTGSLKRLLLKGGSLVNGGRLNRGHKDGDESNGSGSEVEEGGLEENARELS